MEVRKSSAKRSWHKVRFIGLCLILFFTAMKAPAQKATLDLQNHTFGGTPVVHLQGNWRMYWKQLLTPEELNSASPIAAQQIKVPTTWQSAGLETLGFATYQLTIILPKSYHDLSLYIPSPSTACNVWLNSQLAASVGNVSDNPDAHQGKMQNLLLPIQNGLAQLTITIQVSNYTYFIGGITSAPTLGKTSSILSEIKTSEGIQNLLTGCLVAMFLYHLILFFLYRRGISYLYLAGICFIVSLRAMVINGGTYLLPDMFPSIEMEYWKKAEFFCVYMAVILFPLYIRSLFREETSLLAIRIFTGVALPLVASVFFFPQYSYGKLLNICHVAILAEFIFAAYVIFKAWKNRKPEAPIIMLGVACAFPPILFEIINNSGFIQLFSHLDFLVETGILIFLLFQSYLLAKVNANAHQRLEILYIDLEKIVADRTRELTDANQLKDRLLSIISHDIKGPLNSLKGLLTVFNMEQHSNPNELKAFTRTVEDELQRVIGVANTILRWTSSQIKGTEINREQFNLKKFLEEHVHYFHSLAQTKKINLNVRVFEGLTLESDRNIMSLVLRNLISNAIKYSTENSSIEISAEQRSPSVVLSVQDSGTGINHDQLRLLFDQKNIVSTRGTNNEKGTGLGLILCKQYLDLIGGKIWVNSQPGEGSTFFVKIPESCA